MRIWKIAETPRAHNRRKRMEGDIRFWKSYAHTQFDKIWQYWDSDITRDQEYQMLADYLGTSEPEAHMSKMNVEQCRSVAEWAKNIFRDMYERRTRKRHI